MLKKRLSLCILPGDYTIVKLPGGTPMPDWIDKSRFYSITDTGEELSIICSGEGIPEEFPHECSMKIFKINQKLDFSEVGVISSIAEPLAKNKIPIFTISTFDTDYFLIKMEHAYKAAEVLKEFHDVDYYSW